MTKKGLLKEALVMKYDVVNRSFSCQEPLTPDGKPTISYNEVRALQDKPLDIKASVQEGIKLMRMLYPARQLTGLLT
jgi:hypothetical protein